MCSMYTLDDICPVIVTFEPDEKLYDNVLSLKDQAKRCVIIDNGTTGKTAKVILENISKDGANEIIKLDQNYGISYALNKGLAYCHTNGYKLILTMDQDTVLKTGCVKELLKAINEKHANSVGINFDNRITADKEVEFLITSGNLVEVEALLNVNGYDDNLFIDSVDFDISLRLIDAGYKLVKVAEAKAVHKIGEPERELNFFNLFTYKYYTHSANRYYYIARNHFYIIKKYKEKHKLFAVKKMILFIYDLARIFLFDNDKKAKFAAIKNGYKDYAELN